MIIFIGILSGILAGMGIGGGTVLIPMLTMILSTEQKIAQSTNLICFLPIAIASLTIHIKNHNVEIKLAKIIIPFGIIGAIIGSIIAVNLSSIILKKVFSFFLLLIGIKEIFFSKIK
ncbi:MAG: TSUP family transporter [Eubacteriaceae bacterium]